MDARIGIIGGSGLGQSLLANIAGHQGPTETPFGPPAAPPVLAEWRGVPIAFLPRHGRGHLFNPGKVPYRANIHALKQCGCRWIVATGAVGSLNEALAPRDIVVIDQAIDRTSGRASTFFDNAAVHVEFAEPCCTKLRHILLQASTEAGLPRGCVHSHGTYLCMEGPAFSTRAESLLHRGWQVDVIGMTLLPEAKLAREAEISYASLGLITDYDCWRPPHPEVEGTALLEQITANLSQASDHALAVVEAALPEIWKVREESWSSHRALELAIWSDKKAIAPEVRERLALLWGKYMNT